MRKLNEGRSEKQVKYLGEGLVGVYQNGRLVERYQLEKGDNLLEAFGGRGLTEGMMTDAEVKKYVKEEVQWQMEVSDDFTKDDRDEVIYGVLEGLWDEGKISSDQKDRMMKFYKIG